MLHQISLAWSNIKNNGRKSTLTVSRRIVLVLVAGGKLQKELFICLFIFLPYPFAPDFPISPPVDPKGLVHIMAYYNQQNKT